jgi:hypothetical protein
MGKHCIIFLEKWHTSVHEAVEQNRLGMKDFRGDMVYDREIIPKDMVEDTIDGDTVLARDFRCMPYFPCKGSVPAMDAECIHLTLTCSDKMPYTFMSGVKESLPVKRRTFEYDSQLLHVYFLNNETIRDMKRYVPIDNFRLPILYNKMLNTCPARTENRRRSMSASIIE